MEYTENQQQNNKETNSRNNEKKNQQNLPGMVEVGCQRPVKMTYTKSSQWEESTEQKDIKI